VPGIGIVNLFHYILCIFRSRHEVCNAENEIYLVGGSSLNELDNLSRQRPQRGQKCLTFGRRKHLGGMLVSLF
jgi:hypothetical protein